MFAILGVLIAEFRMLACSVSEKCYQTYYMLYTEADLVSPVFFS